MEKIIIIIGLCKYYKKLYKFTNFFFDDYFFPFIIIMNIELISILLENLESNDDINRSKICDLNILCLNYCNDKQVIKSDKIKLKNIISFLFSVLLLIDSNKLDSSDIVKAIKVKALYLKLDLLFDVKEDPSGFDELVAKIL